ncbi:GHKL domain-containing protein [Geomicrobium sp. JCM 19039]|uniref:GHKL domain-containing protein n=1 Tax=Geomicrobium sp. JCM 19039 TaxID=1460636 RepID=UPI00045F285F|nr:GHKL domain-containing protein [Geomicrobium sp. JCM 19039]GAK14286.1 hypothetical protein JCM19039_4192 [Geomicrobium sp. JCM 19039]
MAAILSILLVAALLLIVFLWRQKKRIFQDATEFQQHVQALHESLKQEQHDQRTHLEVLARLAKEHEFQQIVDYLHLLQNNDEDRASASAGGAIGAALAYVKTKGNEDNIRVNASIKADLSQTLLSPGKEMQLMVNIFSNALEGARLSKEYVSEPYIEIEVRKQFGIIIVDVSNSSAPIPIDVREQLFPKRHPTIKKRGLGTYLIQNAVKTAEGSLHFHVDDHTFHLAIRLPSVQSK